jgi:peptidoglycan hydrolase-like protein with peptidoglycan-binding domain
VLSGAAALLAAAATVSVVAVSRAEHATPVGQEQPATAAVERGRLSAMVSHYGTLTYRARPDGLPYAVFDRARGTYTELPSSGDRVECGDVLYRVNDEPVVLLCGSTPAYRSLSQGDRGRDVAELNANLVRLGYANRAQIDPSSARFTPATASALERLQSALGEVATGSLELGRAVFLPEAVRIAAVTGALGGAARPGAQVLSATAETLEVHVALDPSHQGQVAKGDRAEITLPGNRPAGGTVARLGPAGTTVPVSIRLDHPERARGLDKAPVQVSITTKGVVNALSVPVTAIVGRSGGGLAVEVVRDGGRRELVAVKPGLFDTAGGRVQVEGRLREGERVVVPSS